MPNDPGTTEPWWTTSTSTTTGTTTGTGWYQVDGGWWTPLTSDAAWTTPSSTTTTAGYCYQTSSLQPPHTISVMTLTQARAVARLPPAPQLTPADLAAREAERARQLAAREEVHRARVRAEDRATELLVSLLDEQQAEAYRRDRAFEVVGSHGGRYRLRLGVSGNIDWLEEDGAVAARLCAHPTMRDNPLPTQDVVLAQLLALTTDEREFVRIANLHSGRPHPLALEP